MPTGDSQEMTAKRASNELWAKLRVEARTMRAAPTHAEDSLWQELKGRRLNGLKFRRQHAIDRFIVDFYCAEAALVIELDGSSHDGRAAEDESRQQHLEQLGLNVLRFKNEEVETNLRAVLTTIRATVASRSANRRGSPNTSSPLHNVERGRGKGKPHP